MKEGHWLKQVPTIYKAGLSIAMTLMFIVAAVGWTADFTNLPEQVSALEARDSVMEVRMDTIQSNFGVLVNEMGDVVSKLDAFICFHLAEDSGTPFQECLR